MVCYALHILIHLISNPNEVGTILTSHFTDGETEAATCGKLPRTHRNVVEQ